MATKMHKTRKNAGQHVVGPDLRPGRVLSWIFTARSEIRPYLPTP